MTYPTSTPLFNVSDLYKVCYVIEPLLKFKLTCFYDKSCIEILESMSLIALDPLLPTRYSVNSNVQELVDGLMIEEWKVSVMYERYYN